MKYEDAVLNAITAIFDALKEIALKVEEIERKLNDSNVDRTE